MDELRKKLVNIISIAQLKLSNKFNIAAIIYIANQLIANGVTIPVRCKDCKHWCYEYDDVGLCVTDVPDIDGVQRLADDFCSYGEKREV